MSRVPQLVARLQGFGTTIFAEMSALAARHDAVNLGQGFPDFGPPDAVLEAARRAVTEGHNQYAPGNGIPALRTAIADHQRTAYGLEFDPDAEVTVTTGATEAIFAALQALCEVGDEVVVLEPAYDSYLASVAMAGAVPRPVRLQPPAAAGGAWTFDPETLRRAVGPRTRAVLVNSPHNPTGKVLDRGELELVAELCREHDLLAITDEVYEHLVFDGEHVPLATLPGMAERTVTISSAGKTFNVTGWKVGWACAPAALTAAVRTAKQFITFTSGTPFQHAIATALTLGHGYYDAHLTAYRDRRERLCHALAEAGLAVHAPQGSYFATVDLRSLADREAVPQDDVAFCRWLPEAIGVAAVPTSGFYDGRGLVAPPRHLVRFAFCKTDALLDEGAKRLANL